VPVAAGYFKFAANKHLTRSYSILLSQFDYTYDADGQIQSWT